MHIAILTFEGFKATAGAIHYVTPMGEKEDYVARTMRDITPFLQLEPVAA
jgi:hypothetical protein